MVRVVIPEALVEVVELLVATEEYLRNLAAPLFHSSLLLLVI